MEFAIMEKMEIIKTSAEVNDTIAEIGEKISKTYDSQSVTMIVVMNGGLFFASKLAETITLEDLYIDSLAVGSYINNISSGNITLRSSLKLDPRNRHILIVDEVLDSGRTLKAIKEKLLAMGALSVRTVVLVEKKIPRPDGIDHADWAGFLMDDRYLIGCGMDSEEKYRHLPYIAVMK